MTPMTPEELAKGKKAWADAFVFWKTYYHAEDNMKFWEDLVADADKMGELHKGDEFFQKLIIECVRDIERRHKWF